MPPVQGERPLHLEHQVRALQRGVPAGRNLRARFPVLAVPEAGGEAGLGLEARFQPRLDHLLHGSGDRGDPLLALGDFFQDDDAHRASLEPSWRIERFPSSSSGAGRPVRPSARCGCAGQGCRSGLRALRVVLGQIAGHADRADQLAVRQ